MSVSLYNIGKNRRKREKRHGSCHAAACGQILYNLRHRGCAYGAGAPEPDAAGAARRVGFVPGGVAHGHRRAQRLRTFDLADVPYPRDPEASRLRDLKRAVTEECLRGSAG